MLEFFKKPGVQKIIIAIISALFGVGSGVASLQIGGCGGGSAPTTPNTSPAPIPGALPNAEKAINRIQFGNAGCTCTLIGKRPSDGKYLALTAAHCLKGQPRTGVMWLQDGRKIALEVLAVDSVSDCAWLRTIEAHDELPYAHLAEQLPQAGEKIWHKGFGVHVPGNLEEGTVVVPDNGAGQSQFVLSVSSGDSGGGIALNANGEIVSTVCCTQGMARKANVWGANVNAIRALMPKTPASNLEWTPIDIPLRE